MKVLYLAVKNEAPFLLEWIAYHRAIGFDRIVICSNDSDDGTTELLDALGRAEEIVHLPNPVPVGVSAQASAARVFNAAGLHGDGDWVMWLDADEFLNIHAGDGRVDDLIAAIGPRSGMIVPWRIFGDGGNSEFGGRFVSDDFKHASGPDFALNREIKTLFRMGPSVAGFAEAGIHRPRMRPGTATMEDFLCGNGGPLDSGYRMNRVWLRGKDHGRTCRTTAGEFGWTLAQINHYMVRTRTLFALKKARGRGWKANAEGALNDRHTPERYENFNRNEHEDASILRFSPAVDQEIARLRALPGIAAVEDLVRQRLERNLNRLAELAQAEAAAPPAAEPTPRRFKLTLPAAEADLVNRCYKSAGVILEYGSGGSTFLAAEHARQAVFTVESDLVWSRTIAVSVAHFFPGRQVHIHHADIGPTKDWGMPVNIRAFGRWSGYPLSVWDRDDFQHPDVVLIDGRFRPACFLATQFRITRPTTVLIDDYTDRPAYHDIEQIAKPVETVGRMARFELNPMPFPVERLDWIIRTFMRSH